MDTEALISKVYGRPQIWDKSLPLYTNREFVDGCWQSIAKEMNIEEALLRKKWKYLRDQFAVESGKIKKKRSRGLKGVQYTTKWPYFKSLFFLKNIVKPRGSLRKRRSTTVQVASESESEYVENAGESSVFDSFIDDQEFVEGKQYETIEVSVESDEIEETEEVSPKRRKDGRETDLDNRKEILLETINNYQCENEDLLFFLSLLPHVGRIPDSSKLRFRSQIQTLVDEYAYNTLLVNSVQSCDAHSSIIT